LNLVNEVIGFFMKNRIGRIEHFKSYPVETQFDVFNSLIDRAKFTEFGLKYGFGDIKTIKDFQERVPTVTYEEFFPWTERVLRGEKNIIWPSEITWFSKSSGTTNARSKFIPVSEESLNECNYMGGRDLLSLYMENVPDSQLFTGKSVSINGSLHPNPYNEKVLAGDVSAIITKNLPKWAEYFRSPPPEVALMDKWEDKIRFMEENCCHENVVAMLGVPTWGVVLLERMMEKAGAKNALEIWPNFEVFFHGAVAFGPYRSLFKERLFPSDKVNYMESYNASEGYFAIQDDLSLQDQMLLMLDYGIFYEFLPAGEWDKEFPKSLTLDEVELDKSYAIVISSNAGLWRYKLGDTVKFTSKYPFRIKISGRTKHFINAFGEELVVENADVALTRVCDEIGLVFKEYTAAPIYMESAAKGGHEWVIELVEEPENPEEFITKLDKYLREINSDYDAKRQNDLALEMPIVHFVKSGTFMTWLENKGKLGGQHKVPRLSNERNLLEEILKI
jgi:hypothetical protein